MRRKRLSKYIEVESRVAFQHVDPWQVMWYGNYLHYFELARMEILRKFDFLPHKLSEEGYICPITDLQVRYKQSALCDDQIIIRGAVVDNPTASIDFVFEVFRKHDMALLITGSTRQIFLDTKGNMLFYIPDCMKERVGNMVNYFQL